MRRRIYLYESLHIKSIFVCLIIQNINNVLSKLFRIIKNIGLYSSLWQTFADVIQCGKGHLPATKEIKHFIEKAD
jgi:hypothetical protein